MDAINERPRLKICRYCGRSFRYGHCCAMCDAVIVAVWRDPAAVRRILEEVENALRMEGMKGNETDS